MAVATPATTRVPELDGFDDFVRKMMRDWKVNGTAIAIAKDGEIVFAEGFGTRDAEQDLPVTSHTLFPIGSVTKMFTTTAAALLADQGLLDWDTPVRHYLPTFKLWDAFATERMTPRDLAVHRSGLPRHDLLWYTSPRSREELFHSLQYLEPSADFRTIWQYQNLMYMTLGYLVEQLAGLSWEDFVRASIFEPLGMVSTGFSVEVMQRAADFSRGYKKEKNKTVAMPFYEDQWAAGPCGSMISNIEDMGHWMLMHLNQGRHGDTQFVSPAQVADMHAPRTVIAPGKHPEMPHSSYGLAWFVEPYRGRNMIHHGGNIDGFSAMMALMPEENLGVVALTNMNGTPIRNIIPYNVFDRFIDGQAVDWSDRYKADYAEMETAANRGKQKTKSDRVRGKSPSHRLEEYAGAYAHPGYGSVLVEFDAGKLKVTYNKLTMELKPYHYDTFEMTFVSFGFTLKVSFLTDVRGSVHQLSIPLESSVANIVFTRVADAEMRDHAFLEAFVGSYEFMGDTLTVSFKGDVLQVAAPSMPEHELVPVKGTEFAYKEQPGSTIEFQRDASGNVTEAVLSLLGGVFTA